ncbi:MAG TPA: hypothetical protein VMQ76_13090 [Terracidiphilus sp.]|nr:hypothetical protein [Terracidiphilus sp.]
MSPVCFASVELDKGTVSVVVAMSIAAVVWSLGRWFNSELKSRDDRLTEYMLRTTTELSRLRQRVEDLPCRHSCPDRESSAT